MFHFIMRADGTAVFISPTLTSGTSSFDRDYLTDYLSIPHYYALRAHFSTFRMMRSFAGYRNAFTNFMGRAKAFRRFIFFASSITLPDVTDVDTIATISPSRT